MKELMKTYPYNRASIEGRRLFKLLDVQFNKAVLDKENEGKTFSTYDVPSVMQCRANKIGFLFPSNLTGLKRPQIRMEADVELAWGDYTDDVTTLDFTHDKQELPMTYVMPMDDEALKLLIDAGLYRDERFEDLMSKLMADEVFDAEADMTVMHLDAGGPDNVPVLLVEPVHVVHEERDPSEHTTISSLLKRSAQLAIELRKEGVRTDDLMRASESEKEDEVFLAGDFEDVVAKQEETELVESVDNSFKTSSELLDKEIDVTEQLRGSLGFDYTNEDDRIRDLKARQHAPEHPSVLPDAPKPSPKTTYSESIDPNTFDGDDIADLEDEGPEL